MAGSMSTDRPPSPTASSVPALECRRCGAPYQEGAPHCSYCGAGIALEDRGRAALCPRCSARAPVGAAWCPSCGERIGAQELAPVAQDRGCPRCRAALRRRTSETGSCIECSGCGGLWLASSALDELCAAAERAGVAAADPASPPAVPPEARPAYLSCPGCGELMQRRNFGGSSGVVVDVCRGHGVWLDARELELVLGWVRAGGLERERLRRAARESLRPPAPRSPHAVPDVWERPERGVWETLAALLSL